MKEWVRIKNMPIISFAHIYTTTEKYVNHLPPNKNHVEFSYVKVGKVNGIQGEDTWTSESGSVGAQIRKEACDVESEGLLEIHCVGVYCELDYLFPKQTIKIPNTNGFNEKVISIIDELIVAHNLYPDNISKKNALIFSLVDAFNERYNEHIQKDQDVSGEIAYVNKIKKYVITNVHTKIKLSDVAKALHISESYLCIIFKKITGESVVSYINKHKIDVIKNLIISKNLSLKEACSFVGITDPAYASRLFRKYENQSLREFKCSVINTP
jgi:AraC-like DNA-binding protein